MIEEIFEVDLNNGNNGKNANVITVDGWSSGNPGLGGVIVKQGDTVIFKKDSEYQHTNNYFEICAIYYGILEAHKRGVKEVYSDSVTAISWATKGIGPKAQIKHERENIEQIVARIHDLIKQTNIKVLKWDTANLGQIPADPGRK